ncbi:hypothetical protein [Sphingobacterium sp. 2149]|uniref:hypothetical protein n=1 Tax=Sphingobacterium sp. 2149 TaxID=2817763 RepID=UPI00286677FA|nr:hypothetical protein [Sphingobacterium sp. 2149]MDR6734600.1 hypothetical protein [Sphingobacterium sp. 2149]
MKDNKKTELIEEIIGQLKDHELPYKEGSWEKFASTYDAVPRSPSNWRYWSAAAALLVFAGVGYWGLNNDTPKDAPSMVTIKKQTSDDVIGNNKDLKESIKRSLSDIIHDEDLVSEKSFQTRPFTYAGVTNHSVQHSDNNRVVLNAGRVMRATDLTFSKEIASLQSIPLKNNKFSANIHWGEDEVEGAAAQSNSVAVSSGNLTQRDAAKLSQLYAMQQGNTRTSIMQNETSREKKWEMGAFVSPASTSESITLGGGVALAYNISSKISLRSGASIQHYGSVSGNTPITPAMASNSFSLDAPNYISQSTISNSFITRTADAKDAKSNERVSGKILTVDIPVDVRYAITKNFYTSVGVSYVGVLDQERAMIYETNNTEYKQKSTDKNVDDKGVNGFVNFSVGRKQKIGKLSISVEPYYKAPIGGLKSSDLNYSNGGVKIITSF